MPRHRAAYDKYNSDPYKHNRKLNRQSVLFKDTSDMSVSEIPDRCDACKWYLANALRFARREPPAHKRGCQGTPCDGRCRRCSRGHAVGCPNRDGGNNTQRTRTWAEAEASAQVEKEAKAKAKAEAAAAKPVRKRRKQRAGASSATSASAAQQAPMQQAAVQQELALPAAPADLPTQQHGVLMHDAPFSSADQKFLSTKSNKYKTLPREILTVLLRSRRRLGVRRPKYALPRTTPWPFRRGAFPIMYDTISPESTDSTSEAEWALLGSQVYYFDFLRSHTAIELRCCAMKRRSSSGACDSTSFARTGFPFDGTQRIGIICVQRIGRQDFIIPMGLQCRGCGEKYSCADRRILAQLPQFLQVQMPISVEEADSGPVPSRSMWMGKDVTRLTAGGVSRFQGFETVSSLLAELNALRAQDRELAHVSLLPSAPAAAAAAASSSSACSHAAAASSASVATPAQGLV